MNSRDDAVAVARLANRPERFRTSTNRRRPDLPLAQESLAVTAIPVLPLLPTSVLGSFFEGLLAAADGLTSHFPKLEAHQHG
jgi:hypothetical protein